MSEQQFDLNPPVKASLFGGKTIWFSVSKHYENEGE
jgi:hypothetical protein